MLTTTQEKQDSLVNAEIAHITQDSLGNWREPHLLVDHLESVAKLAQEFAEPFNSSSWGYVGALAHDLGKSTVAWQQYIRNKSGYEQESDNAQRIDHSSPSARIVEERYPGPIGRILSYIIAGHHTGLPDYEGSKASLHFRLQQAEVTAKRLPSKYVQLLETAGELEVPWKFNQANLELSLWIRILFSCLVDADFLDTEKYMNPKAYEMRSATTSISTLLEKFNGHMEKLVLIDPKKEQAPIYHMRQKVLFECRAAAKWSPGLFSLTVPTGGGKTLASLGFALEHAKKYGKRRVIYVIPYTSIIEQTADVFRNVLGDSEVVEHHSNFDQEFTSQRIRLASENWDAPIIVTTNVQFFESLFAARPSRCRKLHNIVNSVVIFDEAQMFSAEYLKPILQSLNVLNEQYKATLLFCTATQPVFEKQDAFSAFPGFEKGSMREIIQDVPQLYSKLRRVDVEILDAKKNESWEQLASELTSFETVLCIVSDRKSCRELYHLMPEGTLHLSALMCPQHRCEKIAIIKEKLRKGEAVRVISTQLIEAGVDIDFPVVFRAIAGLDSIAQAAGRCNREGKLQVLGQKGRVILFVSPRKPPAGFLRKATEITYSLIQQGEIDFLDPSLFKMFFTELYWKSKSLDIKDICGLLAPELPHLSIQFRSASESFALIDDSKTRSILIPYGNGEALIEQLKGLALDTAGSARKLFRKLQRYSVSVYINQFQALLQQGSLIEVYPEVYALHCKVEYHEEMGLLVDSISYEPATYIG